MKTNKCDKFKELIIWRTIGSISESEENQLNRHLSECESCAEFFASSDKVTEAMKIGPDPDLKPNPKIHSLLRQRLNELHHPKPSLSASTAAKIKLLLHFRIPVYQVGLAAMALFILFNFSKFRPDPVVTLPSAKQMIPKQINSPYLIKNLPSFENQNVGISMQDDTLLIKFAFKSM